MPKVPKQHIKKAFAKDHRNLKLTDGAVTAIYLDYLLFLKRLSQRAEELAIMNREKTIGSDHFREASELVLKEFTA